MIEPNCEAEAGEGWRRVGCGGGGGGGGGGSSLADHGLSGGDPPVNTHEPRAAAAHYDWMCIVVPASACVCVCGGVRHGPVRRLSLSCVSRRRCGLSILHESFLRSAM
jgi:hypothetical protein